MTTPLGHHDKFCPQTTDGYHCLCDLIDKVRADEQERHGNNCGGMWDEWLHDLRAGVEALPQRQMWVGSYGETATVVLYDDALALLGGDEAEPPTDVDVWNRTFGSASVIRCQYCGDVRSSVTDRVRHEASQHGAVRSDGSSE